MKKAIFFAYLLFGFFISLLFVSNVYALTFPIQVKPHRSICTINSSKSARCHARVVLNKAGNPDASTGPQGYTPTQLTHAYNLTATVSANQTIAIVDAYNNPNVYSDLTTYSTTFNLPILSQCSVNTGTPPAPCFQKVDQTGGTNYPVTDAGWSLEIALDVETAHAICQNCNILLVEANSSSFTDLMIAVDRAVAMGAKYVSNSYGSNEFFSETSFDKHFNVPGVVFTASSGDSGYGTSYPAASRYVTAVGGTTLTLSGNTYLNEKAWSGAGSGCSSYETKPSWQKDKGCTRRTIADVSAVADPSTGMAVYDTVKYSGMTGWFQVGGTSLSSPIIAAVYALKGDASAVTNPSQLPYLQTGLLHDVSSGSNGRCNSRYSYLCNALTGYDGPTGLGTPNTAAAF